MKKILEMFDANRTDALTKEERRNITFAIMPFLLDENSSNLCVLISRYEETVVDLERQIKLLKLFNFSQDTTIPIGTVEFRNRNGKLVGKIINMDEGTT